MIRACPDSTARSASSCACASTCAARSRSQAGPRAAACADSTTRTARACMPCWSTAIATAAAAWRPTRSGCRRSRATASSIPSCASSSRSGDELAAAAICWTSGFVKDIVVHETWRRHGLGEALLRLVFRTFERRGARQCRSQGAGPERAGHPPLRARRHAHRRAHHRARRDSTYVTSVKTRKSATSNRRSGTRTAAGTRLRVSSWTTVGCVSLCRVPRVIRIATARCEYVLDPVGVGAVGQGHDAQTFVAKDVDGGPILASGPAPPVHDHAEPGQPRRERPRDAVGHATVEMRDAAAQNRTHGSARDEFGGAAQSLLATIRPAP